MQRQRSPKSDPESSLPSLAPRKPSATQQTSRDREQPRHGGSSRPRSSHRSRAGCWTCRTRKVKCDEAHPRCGQCTRLNKTCDWEQRWKFDDSTRSTQEKFSNVNTLGNSVWDPLASRSSFGSHGSSTPRQDILPSFADLTTDEDRERKAEGYAPGTYNVIVNPESFFLMPEYARMEESQQNRSLRSPQVATGSPSTKSNRTILPGDPNTIVLTRFEDVAPPSAGTADGLGRRRSLPSDMSLLDISSASSESATRSNSLSSIHPHTDDQLIRHYERFIGVRLLPISRYVYSTTMADPIVQEAHSFAPLHHAICAISLLNLYYRGQARWEDALEREGLATRLLARNIRSDDDLDSDGILFLHFLLLSYDMGNPVNDDQLWVQHMHQIKRIISNRLQKAQVVSEVCWLVFGSATWLEIQASLAGSQAGIPHPLQYVRGILDAEARMIEPMPPQYPCHRQETEFLAPIAIFTHQMLGLTARTSQLANQLRSDHSKIAALQDAISQLQRDIRRSWDRFYPSRLPRDRMEAMKMLTPRCRRTLEAGFMFYFANVIYSSACMYPSQLLSNPALISDVNLASRNILVLAHASLDNGERNLRPTSFAVFIAGACSTEMEVKAAALQCIGRFEKTTISRNASKAKALLAVLFEEQQQQTMRGERAEEVDWITLARERHMELFDFGL